jgi:LEA14-like dessication related protein
MRAALLLLVIALIAGCSKPVPPTLTIKAAKLTQIDLASVVVQVQAEAYNPNSIALSVQSVNAKVQLDGKYDLGNVTVAHAVSLPAQARTEVAFPLAMKWSDVGTLATLAGQKRPIPYTVTGTVAVGGGRLSAELPFRANGVITHDELTKAALRSVLPGVPQ